MYYYDQVITWKQQREYFNSLPLDEFKKGNFFTVDQIKDSCASYLKQVMTLYFVEDYLPSNNMKPSQLALFEDNDTFEVGSREWTVQHEIFGKGDQEDLVSAYQRMITNILVLHPGTHPDVRTSLLDTTDKPTLLRKAKLMMEEDDLDKFFNTEYAFAWDGFTLNEVLCLKEKLQNASMDFDEMREKDLYINGLIDRMSLNSTDSVDRPLDYQYQNLWNKKVAGWMKTKEEHLQVIDQIVSTLAWEDVCRIRGNSQLFYGVVSDKVDTRSAILKTQNLGPII